MHKITEILLWVKLQLHFVLDSLSRLRVHTRRTHRAPPCGVEQHHAMPLRQQLHRHLHKNRVLPYGVEQRHAVLLPQGKPMEQLHPLAQQYPNQQRKTNLV